MTKETYFAGFSERLKQQRDPVTGAALPNPFKAAQKALLSAGFVAQERVALFDAAFVEIMARTFERWIQTEPHAFKEREFLYQSLLALGEVKVQLIAMENLLLNAKEITKNAVPSVLHMPQDEGEDEGGV